MSVSAPTVTSIFRVRRRQNASSPTKPTRHTANAIQLHGLESRISRTIATIRSMCPADPTRDLDRATASAAGRRGHTLGVMRRHPAGADVGEVENLTYEFRVRGRLGEGMLATFDGLEAEVEPVETVLRGGVADQAGLHRILEQIRSLGL